MHRNRASAGMQSVARLFLAAACLLTAPVAHAQPNGPTEPAPTPDWVTPKRFARPAPHPRLFVSQEQIDRVKHGRGPTFDPLLRQIITVADHALTDTEKPMQADSRFSRGFLIQGRLTSLAIQWHRTGDRRYLDAAVNTILAMKDWLDPLPEYSLEHGQYIAGVAVAYDLLHNDLSPEQRRSLVAFARDYCARPFLRLTGRGRQLPTHGERGSWWQHIVSNWNPVCNSGPGMLALTMYEDLDEAQTIIDRVDDSFGPIIDSLRETEGGWVEGLGYWNWTAHYLSLFYISYERTLGVRHEGFRSPGFRRTLTFGNWFVPYDEACGFGDNQHGGISSSLLAAAEFLQDAPTLKLLQDYVARRDRAEAARKALVRARQPAAPSRPAIDPPAPVNIYYGPPQDLLILPDPLADLPPPVPVENFVIAFPTQGWAAVADRWPEPRIYAAVRGGVLGGPHTHDDLLSWHGVVGGERMILDLNKAGYYDSAWEWRAREIYERNPAAKNTLFIAGVSAYSGNNPRRGGFASATVSHFVLPSGPALRLDATRAMVLVRGNPRLVARLFAVLGDKGLLVLDRVITPGFNPIEVRTYTDKPATFGNQDVLLEGIQTRARMTFASDRPALLRRAVALLTDARAEPPTMMRWQTLNLVNSATMASLLTPGDNPVDLKVESTATAVVVSARGDGWTHRVELTEKLLPPSQP